jgi:transposase
MGKDMMMSTKEAQRFALIQQVLDKTTTQRAAARALGLSERQIKRLSRQVREHGALGLISQRRGQASNRRIPQLQRDHFMGLVRQYYADFGPELAREYLALEHGFVYSNETLRNWMIQDGLWRAKPRKTARLHSPRERRPRRGELVQIDGSHHDWFEGRAPKCCLIAFIDDATGEVLGARFSLTETTQAYFDVLRRYVQAHGVPLALYSDRHSIFTKHNPEDPVPTQFERALLQLGIEPIQAYSPQAKGRVERLFQTLQDRLIKAMRLQGVNSMQEANVWLDSYLQTHNQRFAVQPRQAQDAHLPYSATEQALQRICALHHQRQLSAQLSCQFEGSVVQVHPGQAHAPRGRAKVDIVEFADGRLELFYRGEVLEHSRYQLHEHLRQGRTADDKNINTRIDQAVRAKHKQLAALVAQIKHQDAQRARGILTPDTHPSPPPRTGTARYGLRPSQAVPEKSSPA